MYRDDLAATHARVEQLQRELALASSTAVHDQQRIAQLTAQLAAMQQALAPDRRANATARRIFGFATMFVVLGSVVVLALLATGS
jgi:hypothetical protein